uniref:Uncharacterized protein n=1 Tax=Cajanus cajan TaxID=3821 RepID=A0A151R7A3_CAJCA|nr:hypothetical protein KK1_040333 [Cajanus cajan]
MATLQSLRPSFRPTSISPSNSYTFPATPFNYSPKLIASKGVTVTLRHSIISPRVSNSHYSPQIAESLGEVSIFTAAGEPVRFSDLWDQKFRMRSEYLIFMCKSFNVTPLLHHACLFWVPVLLIEINHPLGFVYVGFELNSISCVFYCVF